MITAVAEKALDPKNPEQLGAIGRMREVIQDQVKLWGLNAPAEVNVGVTPSTEELANWVAMMKGTEEIQEADIFADYDDAEIVEEPEAIEAPYHGDIEF